MWTDSSSARTKGKQVHPAPAEMNSTYATETFSLSAQKMKYYVEPDIAMSIFPCRT